MKYRILLLILVFCAITPFLMPVPVGAVSEFTYTLKEDGTAIITKYSGHAAEVEVHWNLDGHMVTEIGAGAFAENTAIQKVKLPVGVLVIREEAFLNCVRLKEVQLPGRLETIEDRAFWGCSALVDIFLPDSVAEFGEDCFALTTRIMCNPGSFAEDYAIYLGQLAGGDSTAEMPVVPASASQDYQYEKRGDGIYITSYVGKDYEVRIPAKIDGLPVRTIGVNAFSSRYGVETVILPEGLTKLDNNAFRKCSGLMRAILPTTLRSIGDHAFYQCENLKEITIPEGVTSIGASAFQGCTQLRDVTLPASLVNFTDKMFYNCHRTLTIHAPKGSAAEKYAQKRGYGFEETD